ncbi:peptidoglycan-binding domain-containing protein (plasmid) [Streptomyces sp. BI20]|uniref:peptidoglycan-binding domain-containing protein n=1 Tax=Streptomyces sp. BI20 TaxID=3403460 RepID=UPI003C71826E
MTITSRFGAALSAVSLAALAALGTSGAAHAAASGPSGVTGAAADYCAESWSQNHPTLSRGSTGNAVRHAQCKLGKWGHPVAIDGVFGQATQNATVAVQRECNITADGIIGVRTWRCLD